jgi:N-methylhydantoinase A
MSKNGKLGIDIGGTFTDLVWLEGTTGKMYFSKTLTTYPDPAQGILNGIKTLEETHKKSIKQAQLLVHGTTLVTNAVIERKGCKTGLITTQGFEDVLEIGREMRYEIYDLFITMPQPLVPKALRVGISERVNKNGDILIELSPVQIKKTVDSLIKKGVQSIAVTLLHSYANNKHEKAIGEYIQKNYPHILVSLSSEVMPEIREYERSSATVMNAYVQPLTSSYLSTLKEKIKLLGFTGSIYIMDSAGRRTTLQGATQFPVQLLESGPAGGTMAAVFYGKQLKVHNLVAFDMGGTTAKASLIRELEPEISNHFEAAREKRFKKGSGLPVRIPVIDMIEIGAGGGSIAQVNDLGLLTVGPQSASSTPGPACYNLGGQNPTVTDADLVLGYLNPKYFLGGTMELNAEKAREAIYNKIAKPLKISIEEAAWGIHSIVNQNMANATRVHIIEKGLDPRFFSMMAFGGAGPVHAFHVAKLTGSPKLIVPAGAGVLSALGFLVSPVAKEEITSYISILENIQWPKLNARLKTMQKTAETFVQKALKSEGITNAKLVTQVVADMRYFGQGHDINVRIPSGDLTAKSITAITKNFEAEYLLRYGRTITGMQIEAVTWRVLVKAVVKNEAMQQATITQHAAQKPYMRKVYWGKKYIDTPVYNRYYLKPLQKIKGPCIIEEFESTTIIGANSVAYTDKQNNIIVEIAS